MPKPDPAKQHLRSPASGGRRLLRSLLVQSSIVLSAFGATGARAGDWDLAAGMVSDVLVRGVALNNHAIVPHASVDYYDARGWFVGLSADLVQPDEYYPESGQLLARAGYAWSPVQDWSVQLGYLHYAYPASSYLRNYAYDEFSASLAWRDTLALTVSASPDTQFGWTRSEPSAAMDLTARYPLSGHLSAVGGIGYRDLHRLFETGYTYGNAGIELRFGHVIAGLAYVATSSEAKRLFGNNAADRWAGSVIWHF
jgi:uncharacterized protein (TIGR02001 family)